MFVPAPYGISRTRRLSRRRLRPWSEACRRSRTPDSCRSPCRRESCSRTCIVTARMHRCRSRCRDATWQPASPKMGARAAHVIEDDLRVRKGAREIANVIDLRMVEPGVEGEAEPAENGEPLAEVFVAQETARRAVGRIADRCVGVPGTDVADAAEAVAAGTNVGGQHRLDAAA